MTNENFSNQFSTLLNSYGSIGQFGDQASHQEIVLDEYEKSVFLTQAQDIIVKSYFDRTANSAGHGMDDNSRRQVDFSSLIKVAECGVSKRADNSIAIYDLRSVLVHLPTRATVTTSTTSSSAGGVTTTTTTYTSTATSTPSDDNTDVLFIINEKLRKYSGTGTPRACEKEYVIKPISHEEYDRQMSKAYTKPLRRQAWRLFNNTSVGFDVWSEIIPREPIPDQAAAANWTYVIRYVKRPRPIVLESLAETDLSIDGVTAETSCELNPILHMDILLKAVELAAASRGVRPVQQTRQEQ